MTAPTQAQYEANEARSARIHIDRLNKAPLADRKAACAKFLDDIKNHPEIVGERLGWLIDGNYGYGVMKMAELILASPRMNQEAALVQLIAAFEDQCPPEMAIAAWKKLTPVEKTKLSKEVQKHIPAKKPSVKKSHKGRYLK